MRIDKAEQALPFVATLKEDNGRPTLVFVPGTGGTMAEVTIRREGSTVIVDCQRWPWERTDATEPTTCEGCSYGHICYHALAALIYSSKKAGQKAYFTAQKEKAEDMRAKGAHLINIRTAYGEGACYLCCFPLKQKSAA